MIDLEILKLSIKEISELVEDKKISVLFGSFVSTWDPTNVISGMQFSSSLQSFIFKDNHGNLFEPTIDYAYLTMLYEKLPFEVINSHCPNKQAIIRIIQDFYQIDRPNLIHALFAELLNSGKINSIITTNYDRCFEGAINAIGERKKQSINYIVTEDDYRNRYKTENPTLLKLHGSADRPETMVYNLSQEGLLDEWKRSLFHQLIKDNILLIIGYSGIDFDICQEISVGKPYRVIWNFFNKNAVSINSHILEAKVNEIRLIGDMRHLIPLMFQNDFKKLVDRGAFASLTSNGKIIDYDSITNLDNYFTKVDFRTRFANYFTEDELLVWQLRLLNTLCYATPAVNLAKKIIEKPSISWPLLVEVLSEYGGALSPNGKYKQAGKAHLRALQIAHKLKLDRQTKIRQINCASDAFRGGGNFLLAVVLHFYMCIELLFDISNEKQFSYMKPRNEILLLQFFYRYAKKFHLNLIMSVMKKMVIRRIKKIDFDLKQSGNYFNINQLVLWAKGFDIRQEELFATHEVTILPPELGYEQLYFPLGKMMDFRNRMNSGELPANDVNRNQIRNYLDSAQKLGITPEVWKFEQLIRKKYPDDFAVADLEVSKLKFAECEYTWFYRIIKRWLGD